MFWLAAQGAEPLTFVQTIPLPGVKGRFDHFSIDVKGVRLFVAALGNNSLEEIDLAAGKRLRSIPAMSKPQGVLYLPETTRILVANGDDSTLKALGANDLKVTHSLSGLPDADNLRLDPHSGTVWVGYGDGALAQVTPQGHKLISIIKLPGHPESFQLEQTGFRIFVNIPDAKQIVIINTKTHKISATWPMETFQANFPMALNESNHRLFVGCRKPARLVIFDTETGRQIQDLEISGDTDDLFYDAKRNRIYLSCGEGSLDVVSQESSGAFKRLAKIQTASRARTCFFSPDLDRLYLAVPEHRNQTAEIRVFRTLD